MRRQVRGGLPLRKGRWRSRSCDGLRQAHRGGVHGGRGVAYATNATPAIHTWHGGALACTAAKGPGCSHDSHRRVARRQRMSCAATIHNALTHTFSRDRTVGTLQIIYRTGLFFYQPPLRGLVGIGLKVADVSRPTRTLASTRTCTMRVVKHTCVSGRAMPDDMAEILQAKRVVRGRSMP